MDSADKTFDGKQPLLFEDKLTDGSSLIIRMASLDDVDSLLTIYNYYVEHTAITFATQKPSTEEFTQLISSTLKDFPFLVAVKEDKPIGYCYAHQLGSRGAFCHSVELSIYLDHKVRALGIGAKLYEVMEPLLKQQGILNLYACIATPVDKPDEYLTDASLHFHHKQGFTVVGTLNQCGYKFERFYNLTWAEKFIGPHHNHQAPKRTKPSLLL